MDKFMLDVCARIETVPKSEPFESRLKFDRPNVSARELITQYVVSSDGCAAPLLVCPTEAEITLNGGAGMLSQSEKNINRALSAFSNNGFVLLVDDHQVECLDEKIALGDASVVTFLRLTPLVGG